MHVFEKKITHERASTICIFVRKVLKELLGNIRKRKCDFGEEDLYSLVQICYEMSNVEEEGQISAFYFLIKEEKNVEWKTSKENLESYYTKERKVLGQ